MSGKPERHAFESGRFIVEPRKKLNLSKRDPGDKGGLENKKAGKRERFLDRLNEPGKLWKFSSADLRERGYWDEYQQVYEETLQATSTDAAPWYVIPADHKWYARAAIADIITRRIEGLGLEPPQPTEEQKANVGKYREALEK